jgi:lipoprotein-releasing system permease protein
MSIPFELQIALRYLLAKRKQALISLISFISIIGVAVGVAAVVIALAVMTGLQLEVRNRILGATAHVYVLSNSGIDDYRAEAARLRKLPHVVGAAPAIEGQALISRAGISRPLQIKGIDPELEQSVTELAGAIKSGSLTGLAPAGPDDFEGILLGSEVAAEIGAHVGDVVSVVTVSGVGTPGGVALLPRRLRVAGTFRMGLHEIDTTYGFVTLDAAKRLMRVDRVDVIQLKADNLDNARAIKQTILNTLASEYPVVQDWTDLNHSLYQALALEKIAISLAIGLIVMVAALNIVATLILLVMEKHRDIAILKTMGTTAKSVTLIFVLQGLIIGIIGTATGGALGYVASRVMDRYKLIRVPEDVYQVAHLPFTVLPLDFALVIAAAILICFVATIYPSRQAARLDPVQALRYE